MSKKAQKPKKASGDQCQYLTIQEGVVGSLRSYFLDHVLYALSFLLLQTKADTADRRSCQNAAH